MSHASTPDAYEFDIVVSFAGEDREFVAEAVDQLEAASVRVLCDSNFSLDVRNEGLRKYLDEAYLRKSRYTVIFISRFYAARMWRQRERRDALIAASGRSGNRVLPIRLDDTTLSGLHPAIGYLDARKVGLAGIVEVILAALENMRAGWAGAIAYVPRTEVGRQQLLLERPTGWEFLYFAAQLLRGRAALEGKYRDFLMGYAPPTDEVICIQDAPDYISRAVRYVMQRTRNLNRVMGPSVQEGAFGRPGEEGNAEAIAHMAMRLNTIYQDLMDRTARIRGAAMPAEFSRAVELVGVVSESPISAYRNFTEVLVAQNDRLPEQIAARRPIRLDMTVTFSIPDEAVRAVSSELARVAESFRRHRRPVRGGTGTAMTGPPGPVLPAPRTPHLADAAAVPPGQPEVSDPARYAGHDGVPAGQFQRP
jgi:TIR domain